MSDQNLTVEQRLKALYELQSILSKIDKIRQVRGDLPLEVRDIEDNIEGLHTRIDNYKREIEELRQKNQQEKAKQTQAAQDIKRYKEQINNIRNNREFDALSKEIELQELDIELSDKHIAENKQLSQEKEEEIKSTEERLADLDHTLSEKRAELEEIISETKQDEEQLREKAKATEEHIDDDRLLRAFKSIRKNAKNGLGVVYIQRNACGGCFNRIPPQRQMEIKMRKKIIVCEYCGRILIDPELAGADTENNGAEQ